MHDSNSGSDDFALATGSVTGREHLRLHRNNQDGVAVRVEPRRIVAALCDGCSAGRSSEVGARLAAAWTAAHLPRILDENPLAPAQQLAAELVDWLRPIAEGLGGADAVKECLLFTLLAAVVEPERTRILGLGDGVFAVDDTVSVLGPFADNAPPYLGYQLVAPHLVDGALLQPLQLLYDGATPTTTVIASDGLVDLAPGELHALSDACARNPSLLQKRLNVWERRFADDASAIVIRRRHRPALAEAQP